MKEYREAEREKIRLSREAKKEGSFYIPAQPKVVFVVRIKGYVFEVFFSPFFCTAETGTDDGPQHKQDRP